MASAIEDIVFNVALRAKLTETLEGSGLSANVGTGIALSFTSGTTSGKADRFTQDISRSLTSGNSEDLDLFDLAGFDIATDVLRNTVTYADIVAIIIQNHSTSAGNLEVGGKGDSTAWTSLLKDNSDILVLPPTGILAIGCTNDPAWAVADTTNHILKMNAPSGNVDYSAWIMGRSA